VIRVLVAASSGVIRAGLEALVKSTPAFELSGSASDFAALAAEAERDPPGAILADLEPPLPAELPAIAPVVLLVGEPAVPLIAEALRAGIRAVLPRDVAVTEIVAAIEAAAAGLVALHPSDVPALLSVPRVEPVIGTGEPLTPRELEVLAMLSDGAGNKTIAWELGISEHTVKFHVASIMSKLDATSRTEAVTIGIRRGLIML
jgi:two-component system, NarL family, response regulator YdfI